MPTYQLPQHIHLAYLNNLFREQSLLANGSTVVLDWKLSERIDPNTYCMILHLKELWDTKKLHITHKNTSSNPIYDVVYGILAYEITARETSSSLGVFISPILSEERLTQDKEMMKRFYGNAAKGKKYDYSPLDNIFSELYMNVCQHSQVASGYIFIAAPNNNKCQMFFSDVGVGIAESIKVYFTNEAFDSDADAIEYATRLNITTKSTIQNQGKGLDNLLSASKGLSASLEIYAGHGLLRQKNVLSKELLDFFHKGTLIAISFYLDNLQPEEDVDDYMGEI
jgi:hypothetical protein